MLVHRLYYMVKWSKKQTESGEKYMNTVQVRDLILGEGMPKICVPVVGRTKEEILLRVEELKATAPDLAEWRADWYEGVFEEDRLLEILGILREELGELPLLVTFRTKQEGGEQEITIEDYQEFLKRVLASGKADLLDVELFMGEELLRSISDAAHACGVKIVASSHDFSRTPEKEEIIRRLCRMQELGADLLKLAAMPQDTGDLLTLLQATWEMQNAYAKQPVITMSMGGTGVLSRLSGEVFGSALTFGSAGQASAPGQIAVKELKEVLRVIHESR